MTLCPAPIDTGIVFQRTDLPGQPTIPARLESVQEWPRCTKLASGSATVQMVEHLLSALAAFGIDNLRIELAGPEIPSGDGSSLLFVRAIEEGEIEIQDRMKRLLTIDRPVFWSDKEVHLVALPSPEFRISYTLHYPQSKIIGSQYYTFLLDSDLYKQEIAPCRTFSLYEEIAPFIEKGLLRGGGLSNALVIQNDQIMNVEGARFPDEMVRHKVLDLLGDLSLIGASLQAHIIAIRSGHSSNLAFAKTIAQMGTSEEEVASNPYRENH